jgi:tRNA 2-thiouridine synthesizing protein A
MCVRPKPECGPAKTSRSETKRRMLCPNPRLRPQTRFGFSTAQAIKNLALGQTLELLATDGGVEPDMRAWCSRTHNELVGITKQGDVFHVLIRRMR